jgi:hypothetical protein
MPQALPRDDLYDLWWHSHYFDRHWDQSPQGCWIWNAGRHRQGYGMCGAWRKPTGEKIMTTCHRLAARRKLGRALEPKECVFHLCGEPACVNPDHLAVGSLQDARDNMRKLGRQPGPRPAAGDRS